MDSLKTPPTHRLRRSELWGGNHEIDRDVHTSAISASIQSVASGYKRGGDVYYLSLCSADEMTRVAVADVRGHGHQVSHLSQWLFKLLEDRIDHLDGSHVLAELNGLVCEHGFDALTTAAVVTYHSPDSVLHYSYAGHPPILVRKGEGAWTPEPIESGSTPANLPLGVLRETRYDTGRLQLNNGDRLFLYTDGVIECAAPDGEFFGDERLIQVLEETAELSLSEVKAAVFQRLREHAAGDLLQDDCTLMILEVTNEG
jgi:sigma-B regulation protein RsbU (phosphoserine phosphatase)